MLVLTRKPNQSIMIGDQIEISVQSVMGDRVRLGIKAPREIPVFRKEVYLEMQHAVRQSADSDADASAEVDAELVRLVG